MTEVGPSDPAKDLQEAESRLARLGNVRARARDRGEQKRLDAEIEDWKTAKRLALIRMAAQQKIQPSDR
ncbi:MAG TPA: hypothetical protein VNF74_08625 [Terriglobales bacterium]|nr:hypothetical protein [Terriglobales bacterium]